MSLTKSSSAIILFHRRCGQIEYKISLAAILETWQVFWIIRDINGY